jgi:hypothetical protein
LMVCFFFVFLFWVFFCFFLTSAHIKHWQLPRKNRSLPKPEFRHKVVSWVHVWLSGKVLRVNMYSWMCS